MDAGREQGRADAASWPVGSPCSVALRAELERLGFDPAVATDPDRSEAATIAFTHCPFRELAEANPDLVCSLHRGLVEGFVAEIGDGEVVEFRSLVHRDPCQVELAGLVAEPGR